MIGNNILDEKDVELTTLVDQISDLPVRPKESIDETHDETNDETHQRVESDVEEYFKDKKSSEVKKFKNSSYVEDLGFSQNPGVYSLYGEIKSKGSILSKTSGNHSKFFFACEIFDDKNELILSIRHRSFIGSDKIVLMVCVQGEESLRKVSIICVDRQWFELNCENLGGERELDENVAITLRSAINNGDSLLTIFPIEENYFYPSDHIGPNIKLVDYPDNYYQELKPFYDSIYKKDTETLLYSNKLNLIALIHILRISFECDLLLIHVGVSPPKEKSLPTAKPVTNDSDFKSQIASENEDNKLLRVDDEKVPILRNLTSESSNSGTTERGSLQDTSVAESKISVKSDTTLEALDVKISDIGEQSNAFNNNADNNAMVQLPAASKVANKPKGKMIAKELIGLIASPFNFGAVQATEHSEEKGGYNTRTVNQSVNYNHAKQPPTEKEITKIKTTRKRKSSSAKTPNTKGKATKKQVPEESEVEVVPSMVKKVTRKTSKPLLNEQTTEQPIADIGNNINYNNEIKSNYSDTMIKTLESNNKQLETLLNATREQLQQTSNLAASLKSKYEALCDAKSGGHKSALSTLKAVDAKSTPTNEYSLSLGQHINSNNNNSNNNITDDHNNSYIDDNNNNNNKNYYHKNNSNNNNNNKNNNNNNNQNSSDGNQTPYHQAHEKLHNNNNNNNNNFNWNGFSFDTPCQNNVNPQQNGTGVMMCNNNWNLDSTTWQSNNSAQQVFNGQHPTVASTQLYNHLQPQYTNHPQHLSNITPLNNLHYPFHLQHNQFQQSIQLPPISQLPSYSANYQPPVANYQPPVANYQPPVANYQPPVNNNHCQQSNSNSGSKDFNTLAFALGMGHYFSRN